MSSENKTSSNEEIVEEITRDFESQFRVKDEQESEASKIAEEQSNVGIPDDFEKDEEDDCKIEDDLIVEAHLKDEESTLNDDELETRRALALELKNRGNEEFKSEKYLDSAVSYTKALRLCPTKYPKDRSILYANRAASRAKLGRKESAIEDCTQALELNESYVKAYLRRATLYEESDKLDESLADYKKVLEYDRGNKDALQAQYRLPPMIEERNEKLKTEMLGKLKDLGNMILRPFGLSTENFQLNQDSNSGGYSINFKQNQ